MIVYGKGSSYSYLEGSHGCDRCDWCHADNLAQKPGVPFPHKPDCPTLTIRALTEALAEADMKKIELKHEVHVRRTIRHCVTLTKADLVALVGRKEAVDLRATPVTVTVMTNDPMEEDREFNSDERMTIVWTEEVDE